MDKINKIILEIKFYFFSAFRKITVGGFVNQLIKKSGLSIYMFCVSDPPSPSAIFIHLRLYPLLRLWTYLSCLFGRCPLHSERIYELANLLSHRVKSGKFGHQVNSDTHLQTVEIHIRRLLMSRLIRIFTICFVNLFFIPITKL